MALSCLPFWCILCLLLLPLISTQHITFELTNGEVNEVVFVGETEVSMKCNISGVQNVSRIEIQHVGTSQAINSKSSTYLQYFIRNVATNDRGYYKCVVTCTDMQSGKLKNLTRDLFLNVVDKRPQCIYNGTKSLTYSNNDVFSITCYCFESDSCLWIRSTDGSGESSLIATHKIFRGGKQILKAVTGTLSDSDQGVKFMCFYGSYFNQRCELGPFTLSTFLNETTTKYSSNTVQSPTTHFSEIKTTENFLDQTDSTVTSSSEQIHENVEQRTNIPSYVWFIVGVVIVAVLAVGVMILLLIILSKSKNQADEYPMHISYNAAFYSESSNDKESRQNDQSDVVANDINNHHSNSNVTNMDHHTNDLPSTETEINEDDYAQVELGVTEQTNSVSKNYSKPADQNPPKEIPSVSDDCSSANSTVTNDNDGDDDIDNSLSSSYLGLDFSDLYAIVDKNRNSPFQELPDSEA